MKLEQIEVKSFVTMNQREKNEVRAGVGETFKPTYCAQPGGCTWYCTGTGAC